MLGSWLASVLITRVAMWQNCASDLKKETGSITCEPETRRKFQQTFALVRIWDRLFLCFQTGVKIAYSKTSTTVGVNVRSDKQNKSQYAAISSQGANAGVVCNASSDQSNLSRSFATACDNRQLGSVAHKRHESPERCNAGSEFH